MSPRSARHLVVGAVVWISVDEPSPDVVEGGIIEIESKKREHVRVRDARGKVSIRHVDDVFGSEIEALRARCDAEAFWAVRYRTAAEQCMNNRARFEGRLAVCEAAARDGRVRRARVRAVN